MARNRVDLPAPLAPSTATEFAGPEHEVGRVQRLDRAVAGAQPLELEDRRARHWTIRTLPPTIVAMTNGSLVMPWCTVGLIV